MNEMADRLDGARKRLRSTPAGTSGRLLTTRAVAERLELSPRTVLRYIRAGELPAIKLPGGAIRITEGKLEEWLAERET